MKKLYCILCFSFVFQAFVQGMDCKGNTENGVKNGLWICFFSNGNKAEEGPYNLGKKNGHWTLYHENGKVSAEGDYQNDTEIGVWKFYDEDGNFLFEQPH